MLTDEQLEALATVHLHPQTQAGGEVDLMPLLRAVEAASRADERERCAAWVDARRDAFCEEHGSIDPDTGTLEFGRGAHAEAKSDYVGDLEEIAAGLRALPGA